jgi:NAD(P)-dependent dehydrogenase (short-subunit alcohol dehydrogenase family)
MSHPFQSSRDVTMSKTALVTGASSGIGDATVRALLEDGYEVFAGARRLKRMAPLESLGARLVFLDLTDDASIVSAVETIANAADRLDVLVNNAGYGCLGALEDVPLTEARRQFEVCVFGLARLCQLILPIMRSQGAGRIVNVGSMAGTFGEPFGAWYHAAKFALEGLSDCLRMEAAPFGVRVIVVEPGTIRTEFSRLAGESLMRASGDTAYAPYARRHAKMLAYNEASKVPSSPEGVARTIVRAVRAARPKARYPTGAAARPMILLRRIAPDRVFDWLMWRISQSFG